MPTQKQKTGTYGEKIAQKYLEERNYKIIGQNFYSRFGEIDLIAWDKKKEELVFIEVKTRYSSLYGYPEEAVDKKKRIKLLKSASQYLEKYKEYQDKTYRFDILALEIDKEKRKAKIYHYKSIEMET